MIVEVRSNRCVRCQGWNFDAETANLAYQAWFTDGSWAAFRVLH